MADLSRLDDEDYPAYTIGQAADLLGVQQAFLRDLDAAGVVSAERSGGGHRRYSRRMLGRVARVRELFDAGHNLAATRRIVELQDQLGAARDEITDLRQRLAGDQQTDETA